MKESIYSKAFFIVGLNDEVWERDSETEGKKDKKEDK